MWVTKNISQLYKPLQRHQICKTTLYRKIMKINPQDIKYFCSTGIKTLLILNTFDVSGKYLLQEPMCLNFILCNKCVYMIRWLTVTVSLSSACQRSYLKFSFHCKYIPTSSATSLKKLVFNAIWHCYYYEHFSK